jgi:hypothetical protein
MEKQPPKANKPAARPRGRPRSGSEQFLAWIPAEVHAWYCAQSPDGEFGKGLRAVYAKLTTKAPR